MNKPTSSHAPAVPSRDIKTIVNAGLARRHAAERRFRWYGLIAISLGLAFVVLMFANIIGKGYPAFWQTYVQVPITFDAAVIDPPRSGARQQAEQIARAPIRKLAYVSCDPASFARDIKVLIEHGFTLTKLTPVDQFRWSPHIELVGAFER